MNAAMVSYRAAMAVAWALLSQSAITEEEYAKIDRIIASKYDVDSSTICCKNPLIFPPFRANMSLPNEEGVT